MAKILVMGDFNLDLVAFLDQLPKEGETLNATSFYQGAGGKGSNQAIAVARLGAEVTFFGAIGDDAYGEIAKRTWEENGVNIDHIIIDDSTQTGLALINVDAQGNNTIAVAQGANLTLTPQHIEQLSDVIRDADIVMCTLGIEAQIVQHAFKIARQYGVTTLLNPAPALLLSQELLQVVDILTPNQGELAIIAGDSSDKSSLEASARNLLQNASQTVIVTLGKAGAQWVTQADSAVVSAYVVDAVDTVGAGDAFNAGFAVALAEGQALTEAIQFANATASLSVQKVGAVAGMPYRDAVDAFLQDVTHRH